MRHDPAVNATRAAVRRALAGLADVEAGDVVGIAVSGGADSLALAAAAGRELPQSGLRGLAVTVDHGLQPGSADVAERTSATCRGLGLDAVVTNVRVDGGGGPEAAARSARYAALANAADDAGAAVVLLGHTLDDQAETVLLGLARGSGARSLSGMAERSGRWVRPFLGVRRSQTRAACDALGLDVWDDPHNADARFARSRVRTDALPALEAALGPGVAGALARSAGLLRDDADALDDLAAKATADGMGPDGMTVDALVALPAAVRRRVLRSAALVAGAPAGSLTSTHLAALDALVTDWRGQGEVSLPGGLVAERRCDRLSFR
jgi:tRNA(Ile)-lysidine synthase